MADVLTEEQLNILLSKLSQEQIDAMSEEEKQTTVQILQDMAKGDSSSYNEIKYRDYKEVPVDIITFLDDNRYLGKAWHDANGKSKLFPYWRRRLVEMFPDNLTTSYNNAIFTGARGLGKSEIAIAMCCYMMYRVMCLNNPREYYGLKPTETIAFAFMNITQILVDEIGMAKFQNTVQMSPWFMEHGTVTGRTTLIWNPPDYIHIIIGSQSHNVIGQAILFCLDGDTVICTEHGEKRIKECVDEPIKVYSIDNDGNIVLSDFCTVKPTVVTNEEYQIELEDGSIIKCTPNHKLMLKDGTYKEAQDLTLNDELADFDYYGYIYKTTNKLNGKVYIGQHKSSFFDASYKGSGKALKNAMHKYGTTAFNVELLEWGYSKPDLDTKEKYYIQYYNSTDSKIGYNIGIGGQGGDVGPVLRKKISETLKGHPGSSKGKNAYYNKEGVIKYFLPTDKIPEGFIKGTCQPTKKDKKLISNGVVEYFIGKDELLPEGFKYCSKKVYNKATFTDEEKKLINKEHYRQAWTLERRKQHSEKCKGKNNPNYGKGCKGGKNGKAIYIYTFKGRDFECRKYLVEYLKQNGYPSISLNTIRRIERGIYGIRIQRKFSDVIDNLTWRLKNEN